VSDDLTVEATGESVSEAKWNALRELELLVPALDKSSVRFQVVSEGTRGLLGVGAVPARVLATAEEAARATVEAHAYGSDAARRVHDVVVHVASAIGVRCRVEIVESDDALVATCHGDDLGPLIGRHGQTIDAVQVLASAIAVRGDEPRREVIVDAAGYRDRRRRKLESIALQSAEDAVRSGTRVVLEPMTAAERKIVHTTLQDHAGVTTTSEGDEPNRYVVVEPV
jgi:spoIIIJ-associated protein